MRDPLDLARVRAALSRGGPSAPGGGGEDEGAAAVAAILRDRGRGAEVLFIRRAERVGDPWSGQMAFPGGRRAGSDASLLQTAVREVREEIGLDLEAAELVGQLDDVEVVPRAERSRGFVRPFVFGVEEVGPLALDRREVAEVVWAPLAELMSGARATTTEWRRQDVTMTFPGWDVGGRVVWGLTYRMLSSLFERLGGDWR